MARPKKIRYSAVGVLANGYLLSRVQNVSANSDMGEEEAKELTNTEVVEYTSTSPSVAISIETNEYGSCRNLRAVAGITGGTSNIYISSFDNMATDITILAAEDGTLARSCLINDAYLSSISWNYDVGGVATESFNFDADNKTWYTDDYKEAYSVMGITVSGDASNGYYKIWFPFDPTTYDPLKVYIDGVLVTGALAETAQSSGGVNGTNVTFTDINFANSTAITTGYRNRCFIYKNTPETTIQQVTSRTTTTLGSIPRGKVSIFLATGFNDSVFTNLASPGTTNFLRLQSVSVSVDLARETLNELGHYRAFERSLTYPVPVNVTFSTIANDMTEWAKFTSKQYGIDAVTGYAIGGFTKTSAIGVGIYDKLDTDLTRVLKKAVTVSGLQIISESFGVDVGGNATQDFTAKATYFCVSGVGTPGFGAQLDATAPSD